MRLNCRVYKRPGYSLQLTHPLPADITTILIFVMCGLHQTSNSVNYQTCGRYSVQEKDGSVCIGCKLVIWSVYNMCDVRFSYKTAWWRRLWWKQNYKRTKRQRRVNAEASVSLYRVRESFSGLLNANINQHVDHSWRPTARIILAGTLPQFPSENQHRRGPSADLSHAATADGHVFIVGSQLRPALGSRIYKNVRTEERSDFSRMWI